MQQKIDKINRELSLFLAYRRANRAIAKNKRATARRHSRLDAQMRRSDAAVTRHQQRRANVQSLLAYARKRDPDGERAMKPRIRDDYEHVVNVTRVTQRPLYERIASVALRFIMLAIIAGSLFWFGLTIITHIQAADAAAHAANPTVCVDYDTGHYVCEH